MRRLTKNQLLESNSSSIQFADYASENVIEGVKLIPLTSFPAEDGDLSEIFRITKKGTIEQCPDFKIAQMNRVRHNAGAKKAWHLHLKQDELWYVSPYDHLFVGLWDVRKNSKTKDLTMRVILGGTKSSLLFIPRGVAHGTANFIERPVDLLSITNKHFIINAPDELRMPWDALGKDFWEPLRD